MGNRGDRREGWPPMPTGDLLGRRVLARARAWGRAWHVGYVDSYGPKLQVLFALCRSPSEVASYAAMPTPSLSWRKALSTASYSRSSLAWRARGTRLSLATGSSVLAVSGAYSRW